MLILRDVARGLTRFDQLRVNLGIAPNILTRRLHAPVDTHVLSKHRYNERPPRDEYLLTDAGKEFLLAEWGRRSQA